MSAVSTPKPTAGRQLCPLILTLALDPASQARFERERKQHYPARLNRIPAHVSLFHALPGEEIASIERTLGSLAAATAVFPLEVHDLMRLGRGVAYALHSPELQQLHAALREPWLPWLSRQDRQPFRPHVVIQNKVMPEAALALHDRLAGGFRPFTVRAEALLLWHYEGGPWRQAANFPLAGPLAGDQP